ncbi:MAG: rod shape-determining protein MreC [Actinomycetota bacterium]|nr:rod shape-determining protein MreC [Actinomycetota bacterium]
MYRRSGRGRVLLLVFLVLSIVVITIDFRQSNGGALERAKDVSSAVITPIQRGLTTVFRPVGNFFSSIGQLGSLRSDNAKLREQVRALTAEIDRAQALEAENEHLRELSGLSAPWFKMEHVAAEVIGTVPTNYKWAVYIDKGSSDGIKPNMAVIDVEGLVGKTVHVEAHQSTVLMIVDPQGGAAAKLEAAGFPGLLKGNGGGQPLSLQLIPSSVPVAVGDKVVTSNYNGGIYPANIPIGVVTRAGGDARSAEQAIDVQPYVDFSNLDYVEVLLGTGSKLDTKPGKGG